MPFYSPDTNVITFRIVYDGLGTAGKTTNVQKLYDLYTLKRQGPIVVPEVVHGRTAYFDWLELSTGTFDDRYELRCQILTVPGQFAYAPRRWQLLRQPDVIVCVCDSSAMGLPRARIGLEFMRELRERGICPDVPIVLQANKRDLPDAVPMDRFREELDIHEDETVTEAVASTGEGVQLTFYRALDAARESLRRRLEHTTPSELPPPETADDLLASLRAELGPVEDDAYSLVDTIATAARSRD